MKNQLLHSSKWYRAALTGALALLLVGRAALALDVTNAATGPAKHNLSLKFDFGTDAPATNGYYGLPKEAFDRLSPQQILALAKPEESVPGVAMVVPVAMFAMIVACVWLGVSQRSRRAQLLHETLRLMIEKGQPIPVELLHLHESPRRPRNDLRRGLIFISIGIGLGVLLLTTHDEDWPVALIPLLIGVAFLIAHKLEQNSNGQPK